ncbi:MAG: hypothetical protein NTZ03_10170 [Actinobacteria bacterium]|nr:hypothetical protein [Actinomycetota bacterium]
MRYIGTNADVAQEELAAVGVQWYAVDSEGTEAEIALIAAFLPEGERQLRGTFDAEPPAAGEEHLAHCAWHTNRVDEVHTFLTGLGRFEFRTPDGLITVLSEPGDVMVNRGAEHRFLPLTSQRLRLRHSGPVEGDFGYIATATVNGPWLPID